MKFQFSLILAISLVFGGCGGGDDKKDSKQTDAPGQNPLNAPTDYVGALAKGKKKSESTAAAVQLGPAIKAFHAGESRYPKNLQELVDEGYIRALPEIPKGMKVDYNPDTGEFNIAPVQ